ncbi:hypothetical protein L0M92_16345, partial [Casaltella massiliensis]|nr:hypothetical protein [Casaltella massiliensis]
MEDKKRILKMVEEGKITSEEAIKLLEALETSNSEKVDEKKDISAEEFLNITPNPDGEKMLYVRVL